MNAMRMVRSVSVKHTLEMDLERLQRVNRSLDFIPEELGGRQKAGLRMIETLVIRPSEPIAEIAAAHADELPRLMRWTMSRAGVLEPNGARVLSYLLLERGYCRHLMRLGFSDAMAQRGRILNFLGYGSPLPRLNQVGVGILSISAAYGSVAPHNISMASPSLNIV